MKFLELHFNPKLKKKDTVFDTFCFAPETREEENLGNLYLIGELKNILPINKQFLTKIAEMFKDRYYKFPKEKSSECFKQGLNQVNEFLAKEIKNNNVSWLGNLNFAVFSLAPDFSINLSKIGNLKILLLREDNAFNIASNLNENGSSEKIFSNLIEGKLSEGDKILLLTNEVFETFKNQEIIERLSKFKKLKGIKKFLKKKKKILQKISGVCLLIIPEKKGILSKKIYLPKIPSIFSPSRRLVSLSEKILPHSPTLREKIKKSLIALLILIILLFLGWLIFK